MVTKELELADDQLIQNSFRSDPWPAWILLAAIVTVAALLFSGASHIFSLQHRMQADNPFLQVTNREFSLFLWQFPEYMRVNVSSKAGYLPGFQYTDKIGIELGQADDYVSAPPEVLVLYHTWKGTLGDSFSKRAIPEGEFLHFLEYAPEWLPDQWLLAPPAYRVQVERLTGKGLVVGLPEEVERAFIGWKNYFLEGDLINRTKPTYAEMEVFLEKFPLYARNYWRNIVMKGKPEYLRSLKTAEPAAVVPDSEMAAFLRVAYFNFTRM
jgi:hypothetical protein